MTAQACVQLSGTITPLTLFVPGFFISMAQGISLPYAQAGAMAINPKLAGTAAGIGVFMQNFAGAAFAQLYGLLANGTVLPLAETTAITGLFGLIVGSHAVPHGAAARSSGLAWSPIRLNCHCERGEAIQGREHRFLVCSGRPSGSSQCQSNIATGRIHPAEPFFSFDGKHATVKPSPGSCSRLHSFSM